MLVAEWELPAYLKDTQVKIKPEFQIIKKYLSSIGASFLESNGVQLSVGDDCAVLQSKKNLLISTDTSVAGVHFLKSMPPKAIAYRAVSTAMSDIAAMGGHPLAFNLSLVMPSIDEQWMKEFRSGLQKISKELQVTLIGGDLAKGPMQVSVTVFGKEEGKSLLRSGASAGDILCVSGALGSGYLAFMQYKSSKISDLKTKAYLYPKAQIEYGKCINQHATSAIDLSDGLMQDLSHIILASSIGCEVNIASIPLASSHCQKQCLEFGDDYQLLYTVAPKKIDALKSKLKAINKSCHTIGTMQGKSLKLLNNPYASISGYSHFN